MTDTVRVRFAPSPTGNLHIGGARTALFNWLFAQHNNGTFILRIEDTDRARFDQNALDDIYESLEWLGLIPDESNRTGGEFGPYVQSERCDIYHTHITKLLDSGHAYKCYCTSERLAKMREEQEARGETTMYDGKCKSLSDEERAELENNNTPYVVRFASNTSGDTLCEDAIRGTITYPNDQLDDFIILKTDGFPTYHFASVVDDHLMEISHVMRGEEWIPSMPKHVQLYDAFGWKPPVFVHLPVILAPGGGKLSKRHGATAVREYRTQGFLPEALVNFLALLGWAYSGDQEIVPLDDIISAFSLRNVSASPAKFDREKLSWMNGEYIRALSVDELTERIMPILKEAGLIDDSTSKEHVQFVVKIMQQRLEHLTDICETCDYFFTNDISYEEKPVRKFIQKEGVHENLCALYDAFKDLPEEDFSEERLEKIITDYLEESEQPLKKVVHPLRVAITGKSFSPGIFDTLTGIGKERVLNRIKYACEHLTRADSTPEE